MSQDGHCILRKGDVLDERYIIDKKIGEGRFSKCWSAVDKDDENKEVAIKVSRNDKKSYIEMARDELDVINTIKIDKSNEHLARHISIPIRSFDHALPSSSKDAIIMPHVCTVYEKMDCNLLDIIERKYENGMPQVLVKLITKQLFMGLQLLHSFNIIHTDIKPENILIKLDKDATPPTATVKICDFGCACWTYKHFTDNIGTTEYRAPEVLFNLHYDTKVDVWAVACTVFELLTGDYLFDPNSFLEEDESDFEYESESDMNSISSILSLDEEDSESDSDPEPESDKDSEAESDDDEEEDLITDRIHLNLMHSRLGPFPKRYIKKSPMFKEFFRKAGNLEQTWDTINNDSRDIKSALEYHYEFSKEDAEYWHKLLIPFLQYNPNTRARAEELLM